MPLRGQQLAFRHHEVYTTYSTFMDFINGKSVELETIEGVPYDRGSWVSHDPSVRPPVRADRKVVLAGHSFGGCTMVRPHERSFFMIVFIHTLQLSILSTKPLEGYYEIPVERALVLDPWLEPLATPGPLPTLMHKGDEDDSAIDSVMDIASKTLSESTSSGDWQVVGDRSQSASPGGGSHPRMLVLNSEIFTLWKDHFARLEEVVARWEPARGSIMTISKSSFRLKKVYLRVSSSSWLCAHVVFRLSHFTPDREEERSDDFQSYYGPLSRIFGQQPRQDSRRTTHIQDGD